jgi:D-3-phosphoglycerate dehydrogenase
MIGMKAEFTEIFLKLGIELVVPEFTQVMSEDELCRILPSFDGWIIGDDPASEKVLTAGKNGRLRAVVKWGVGTDNVDFTACDKLGIPVSNTPGMFGREVADIAIGYIIGLARQTFLIDRSIRRGEWPKIPGSSLAGKRVAVVGYGDIGRNIVKRTISLDMEPVVFDPFADADAVQMAGSKVSTWPESIEEFDFIVFCCALTAKNRHMLDSSVLNRCKQGVFIVNVARGPLIDQAALIESLSNQTVQACALDVFEDEPLGVDSPLLRYDRCIFGSHNASNTKEAVRATSFKASKFLLDALGFES